LFISVLGTILKVLISGGHMKHFVAALVSLSVIAGSTLSAYALFTAQSLAEDCNRLNDAGSTTETACDMPGYLRGTLEKVIGALSVRWP
jgi:hypothetical protein